MKIILGSKSPRRQELLKQCHVNFEIDEAKIEEVVEQYDGPKDYVKQVATKKGEDVFFRHPDDLVICADTIVCLDQIILGKPKNQNEAKAMIQLISGKTHAVFTAVYLRKGNRKKVFVTKTKVTISKISQEDIDHYVMLDEPYDKAGAYAIQGFFGKYVKKINGDFYNVMGLPINRLSHEIKKFQK
ncbi:MAG: nucleoside triphosphate pyrophosphatase [Bacilli bacterium]